MYFKHRVLTLVKKSKKKKKKTPISLSWKFQKNTKKLEFNLFLYGKLLSHIRVLIYCDVQNVQSDSTRAQNLCNNRRYEDFPFRHQENSDLSRHIYSSSFVLS